jgi:hypothetical protein
VVLNNTENLRTKINQTSMAPIHMFFLMAMIQAGTYFLLERIDARKWRPVVLGILLILNLFILPDFFNPEPRKGEAGCGMPVLGIKLGFWIFGSGLILFSHFAYDFFSNLSKRNESK